MKTYPSVQVGSKWITSKGDYYLTWRDPITRKERRKKTNLEKKNSRNKSKADKMAEAHRIELNESLNRPNEETTWEEFQVLYQDRLSQTSPRNQTKWRNAVAIFDDVWPEYIFGILRLDQITPRLLLAVENEMRIRLSAGSIDGYIGTLRAGINYAGKLGLMPMLPPRPQSSEDHELPAMRLANLGTESLERLEWAAPKVVGKRYGQEFADYIRCLWLCGGRLSDPLWMHPFRVDCHHPIVLSGDRPLFGWTNRQKNRRDQMAPITLDFAVWIKDRIERLDRDDMLFNPTVEHGRCERPEYLSKIISDIGAKAGVIAEPSKKKTWTAKHGRSGFATRWSSRGMELREVSIRLRHSSPKVTEKYYVAPHDPSMIANFCERDWIGDQKGDQTKAKKTKSV